MQAHVKNGQQLRSRLNWLPQRSILVRQTLGVTATSGPAAPQPIKELPSDTVTRQYRRVVFDFNAWTKHRDVNRYLYNLKTIPGSRIIRTLGQPMGVVLAWSALFGFYETCIDTGVLPAYFPKLTLMSAEPQGLTSFALSLLLVFRTNSSYGRFDEARKIWGGILNRARNIANQAVTFIPPEDATGREAVGKWTVGFCRALQAHLQEDADLRVELQKAQPRWTQDEIDMLCSAQHRPIKAISVLSELTRQLPVGQFQALQMQENVTFFYDALGGCERLLRTPIPVSYTRHTARFLTIWLALLPLGLWERYHWSMLPVIALIGFLLLGIDEIGITIEEPFGILPLDAICIRAQTDVVSLLTEDPLVSKYVADVREGRIRAQVEPPSPKPALRNPPGVMPAATVARSVSPPASGQPGVLRTMASLFNNVKAGVGAVAPGKPPSPPRSPSPSRPRSPVRAGSPIGPSPFPPASAGTGRSPPPPPPSPATAAPTPFRPSPPAAPGGNGKGSGPVPPLTGSGRTMSSPGLGDSAKSANEATSKLPNLADRETVEAVTGPGPAKPPPAATPAFALASPSEESMQQQPPTESAGPKPALPATMASQPAPSPATASSPELGRSGSRVGVNWRDELAALRASRLESQPKRQSVGSWSDMGSGSSDEADDEAIRRFGNLGRPSSDTNNGDRNGANGNGIGKAVTGNGSSYTAASGSSESSRQRPRTRPDWRDQL